MFYPICTIIAWEKLSNSTKSSWQFTKTPDISISYLHQKGWVIWRRLVICKFGKIYLPIWWSPENLIIYVNRMPFISEHSNKMPFSSYNIFENHLDRGLSGFKSFLERDFAYYCLTFLIFTFEVFLNKVNLKWFLQDKQNN